MHNKLNLNLGILNFIKRENLIPHIGLDHEDSLEQSTFYNRQSELMEFFETRVNKSEKLAKRFEEFSATDNWNSLACGV